MDKKKVLKRKKEEEDIINKTKFAELGNDELMILEVDTWLQPVFNFLSSLHIILDA